MKQTTRNSGLAFCAGHTGAFGNATTRKYSTPTGDCMELLLFGNRIAWTNGDDSLTVTLAGYPTPTTREHLNGLLVLWCAGAVRAPAFWQANGRQAFGCLGPAVLPSANDQLTVNRSGQLTAINGEPV